MFWPDTYPPESDILLFRVDSNYKFWEENCVQQKETIKRKSQNNDQGQANCCPPQSQDIKVSSNPFLLIQKIKDSDKIPLVPMGVLAHGSAHA